MNLKTTLFGSVYKFKNIKDLLAKANEEKSGDMLAGVGATSTAERVAAKIILADTTIEEITNNPAVSYEEDEITRVIQDSIDKVQYKKIKTLTIGELRDFILSSEETEIKGIRDGLTSEVIAAVTKLMSNMDLVYGAQKLCNTATCNTTIGKRGTLSSRLQPNHPTDDVNGIMASLMEGLSYGVGDAVIGLNPVVDTIDSISTVLKKFGEFTAKWNIPTQNCVLAHVTTQMEALKNGVPIDLMFQSLAGSEISNRAFGISVPLIDEAYGLMKERKSSMGPNFMYFETGQGSELSSEGHNNADQLVMEARCYGFAKRYKPFLVNTVVGFIGPE
jgi:ethanolamine ammonia-lyase large subunit